MVPNGYLSRRVAFALMYLLYSGVGLFQLLADTSPAISATLGASYWVWSWMLLTGGVVAATGSITKLWLLEVCAQALIAIPFLFWCWFVFKIHTPTWTSSVCLLLAIASGALIRCVDLLYLAARSRA